MSMLSDGSKHRLVVSASVDTGQSVGSSGQSTGDCFGQDTTNRGAIDTFEERKGQRIRGRGLSETGHLLDDKMRVTDNSAAAIDLARSSVVVGCGGYKVTSDHVANSHSDVERLVSGDGTKVRGESEFGRGEDGVGDDTAHDGRVAGPSDGLKTVCKGGLLGGAEVDEVVGRCQRGNLASLGNCLTILRKTRLDLGLVEVERGLKSSDLGCAQTGIT